MLLFILRRLGQSVLTIFGVMIITFLLFRVWVAGDIAAANINSPHPTEKQKSDWRHKYGYDRPMLFNHHKQLVVHDLTTGDNKFTILEGQKGGSNAVGALALVVALPEISSEEDEAPVSKEPTNAPGASTILGRFIEGLSQETPVAMLTENQSLTLSPNNDVPQPKAIVAFQTAGGKMVKVDLTGAQTAGEIIDRINNAPDNKSLIEAGITKWKFFDLFNSQFFHHLKDSVTFETRSFKTDKLLVTTIKERAQYSLAIMVPVSALEFLLGLWIAAMVAYYRGRPVDKIGVFLSVLGMCVPFLAFMIYGQMIMFWISPASAYGIFYESNLYLPIGIMVVGGVGGIVRFYRTVILDETNRDYVRTARAKGLPLRSILFKHVLRNCMLPILTQMILGLPFLIMGSLLVENYFGIPGLGDLMVGSITTRDEPIINGMVFLTALVYTIGILLTDISYAIFDPRVRLS